jgi:hypothetical protein
LRRLTSHGALRRCKENLFTERLKEQLWELSVIFKGKGNSTEGISYRNLSLSLDALYSRVRRRHLVKEEKYGCNSKKKQHGAKN